jgi:hypothetical protein
MSVAPTFAAISQGRGAAGAAPALDGLTQVELLWIEGKIERWVRFGRATSARIVDRRRRIVCFAPGSIFAFVRWRSNDYGTVVSRIDIVVPVIAGRPHVSLPGVTPGGDILLHLSGWPKVEAVLQAVDMVEAIGVDPCDAAPDHWRHVHNRLAAGLSPRTYALDRHRAWLQRKDLQS